MAPLFASRERGDISSIGTGEVTFDVFLEPVPYRQLYSSPTDEGLLSRPSGYSFSVSHIQTPSTGWKRIPAHSQLVTYLQCLTSLLSYSLIADLTLSQACILIVAEAKMFEAERQVYQLENHM